MSSYLLLYTVVLVIESELPPGRCAAGTQEGFAAGHSFKQEFRSAPIGRNHLNPFHLAQGAHPGNPIL